MCDVSLVMAFLWRVCDVVSLVVAFLQRVCDVSFYGDSFVLMSKCCSHAYHMYVCQSVAVIMSKCCSHTYHMYVCHTYDIRTRMPAYV